MTIRSPELDGDHFGVAEVRDRPGHLEDAVVTAGREPQSPSSPGEQLLPRRREGAVAPELPRRHPRVEALRAASQARPLALAGSGDPPPDRRRLGLGPVPRQG